MSEIELPADQRSESAFATLRRGLRMMPEFRRGLPVTFLLALIATAGRVVVPIAVQQTIAKGLLGPDGPDLGLVRTLVLVCAVVVVITAVAVYRMNVRLFRTTETALAGLRARAAARRRGRGGAGGRPGARRGPRARRARRRRWAGRGGERQGGGGETE